MYKNYYQQIKVKDTDYEIAYKIWLEYTYETELYDRSICLTIDESGFGVPTTINERKNSHQYAYKLAKKRDRLGQAIDSDTWYRAKSDVLKMSWNDLCKYYEVSNK